MEAKDNKRVQKFPVVTQEKLDAILKDIAEYSPKKHAAESNGISERQFYYLLAQGIVDLEVGKIDTIHARLVQSLRAIEKKEIKLCRERVSKSEDGHKGAQWTLEHAYWRYFGKDANAKELAEQMDRIREDMKGVHNGEGRKEELDQEGD